MFHVPHSAPKRHVRRESRILLLLCQPYHHLQIQPLSDDKKAACLTLVTHECALPIYERRDTHRLRVSPSCRFSSVAV